MKTIEDIALFELGRIMITPGAFWNIPTDETYSALLRHVRGDWGDVDEHDQEVNDDAVLCGNRLLSTYQASSGTRFWIITERDRSCTTILLPNEY